MLHVGSRDGPDLQLTAATVRVLGAGRDDHGAMDNTAALGADDLHQQRPSPARYRTLRLHGQQPGAPGGSTASEPSAVTAMTTFSHRDWAPSGSQQPPNTPVVNRRWVPGRVSALWRGGAGLPRNGDGRHAGGVPTVVFRPLTEADLTLVARWLREEHVQKWWKDPSAPERVREKYLPRIRGDDPTNMYVIMCDGQGVGLIQSYCVGDHPGWAKTIAGSGLAFPSAASIDYLIGERHLVGQGIGSTVIGAFTDFVFAADPDVEPR